MTDEKRSYRNAGTQTRQAFAEVRKYGELPPTAFVTLKTVSLILGINRNKVKQIPIEPVMIDKRKCYRKGDIALWMAEDSTNPEGGLLTRLRAEQATAAARMAKDPSRRYTAGQISKDEANGAKNQTKTNMGTPFTRDEQSGGWDKGLARRRNSPILPPKPMTEAEAAMEGSVSDFVRALLKASELK